LIYLIENGFSSFFLGSGISSMYLNSTLKSYLDSSIAGIELILVVAAWNYFSGD